MFQIALFMSVLGLSIGKFFNNLFPKNYSRYKKSNYKNENSELDKLNADRVNNNSFTSLREKNLLEAIFNNPTLLKKVEEDFALLVFSKTEISIEILSHFRNDCFSSLKKSRSLLLILRQC